MWPLRYILKCELLRHGRVRMERTSFILFAKWQEVRVQRQDHAMFSSAQKTELWWILAGFFPDPKGCFTMRGRAWESIQAILQKINCHIVLAAISINQSIRVALDLCSWLTLRDVKQAKTRQNFGSLWIWHLASYITWSCNFLAPIKNKYSVVSDLKSHQIDSEAHLDALTMVFNVSPWSEAEAGCIRATWATNGLEWT